MSDDFERLYERLLVVRCQAGDEAAFGELVARFSPRIRYFLRKLHSGSDRVDDLLQEVWLDVFRQLPRLNDAAAFPAWIYRIARGRAALLFRRENQTTSIVDVGDLAAPSGIEPEFSADEAARIHAALDHLTSEQREVLVLRFLEDLDYEAIAHVTGLPLGTVRSRIHYAKQALRRVLESES